MATGSEPPSGPRPRLTLRTRLTLLYGGCFIVAAAVLLAITYGVFSHSTATDKVEVRSGGLALSSSRSDPVGKRMVVRTAGGGSTTVVGTGPATTVGANGTTTTAHPIPRQISKAISQLTQQANGALLAQSSADRSRLLVGSGIALAIMAVIAMLLARWLAGRVLRPLRTMNARARAITEESLHERLSVDGREDELGELAASFDDLLARLERAFDALRQFTANASHELRTPLTLERTLVEVALADPDASADSLRRVCERVVVSTEQQERLIEALLVLARSQGAIGERREVDLAVTVGRQLVARARELAPITIETALSPAPLDGDPALIDRLVANLVDNAIVHNAGGEPWIRIGTSIRDGCAVLTVANGGSEIPSEVVRELFEPFRRLEGHRLGGGPDRGLGLGLSIVRAIATAHGADLRARALDDGGLELELSFAAGSAAAAA